MTDEKEDLNEAVILLSARLEELTLKLGGLLERLDGALAGMGKVLEGFAVPDIMDVEQAASYIGLEPGSVAELAASRGIPATEVEGDWRFSRAALSSWVTEASWRNLE